MKVLFLNTYDTKGGAALVAMQLHQELNKLNTPTQLLVQEKYSRVDSVLTTHSLLAKFRKYCDVLPLLLYPGRQSFLFSSAFIPERLASIIEKIKPDIVHLHWVGRGFLKLETLLQIKTPLVWTLHDSWAFTGGCHVPGNCTKYRNACGDCPLLGSSKEQDLSRQNWRRKKAVYDHISLTIVSPSKWLKDCAQSSSLLKDKIITVIPHGINKTIFKPQDKTTARKSLGLPGNKKIVLYGANNFLKDQNKGWAILQEAMRNLANREQTQLVVFGEKTFRIPGVISMGFITNQNTLAQLYSAADLVAVPSRQEAFGQVAQEAIACGTPVVAFAATGLLDIVKHKATGYLAKAYEKQDFAEGINWVLGNAQTLKTTMSELVPDWQDSAKQYINLYKKLLGTK